MFAANSNREFDKQTTGFLGGGIGAKREFSEARRLKAKSSLCHAIIAAIYASLGEKDLVMTTYSAASDEEAKEFLSKLNVSVHAWSENGQQWTQLRYGR